MSDEVRAVGRLGWRMVRRDRWRSLLIVALIALPVFGAVVTVGLYRASQVPPRAQVASTMGAADVMLSGPLAPLDDEQEGAFRRAAAGADATLDFTTWWAVRDDVLATTQDDGGGQLDVTDLPLDAPIAAGMRAITGGRALQADDEVVASEGLLRSLDRDVGDTLVLADGRRVAIVGSTVDQTTPADAELVVSARTLQDLLSGAGVGTGDEILLAGSATRVWLLDGVDAPGRVARHLEEAVDDDQWVMTRRRELRSLRDATLGTPSVLIRPPVVATIVAGLLLTGTGLIAAAAYATGARRRLRVIGLLQANGATARHVRMALLGEAVVAGTLGGALGVLGGVAAVTVGRPLLHRYVVLPPTDVTPSPQDLVGPLVVAVAAAVAAAWVPTRNAAQVTTVAALHGRMPTSAPPRWVLPTGVIVAVTGAASLFAGMITTDDVGVALGTIGVAGVVIGVALLTVPVVALGGRVADRLPSTLRLVARDAARQRTRAAAACSAAMVVLALALIVGTMEHTVTQSGLVGGLPEPDDHVSVGPVPAFTDLDRWPQRHPRVVSAVSELVPDATRVDLGLLGAWGSHVPARATLAQRPHIGQLATKDDAGAEGVRIAQASPALLGALDEPRVTAAIDAGHPVVLGIDARDTQVVVRAGHDRFRMTAREVPVPVTYGFPRLLLPADRVDRLDLHTAQPATLFVTPRPLDAATASRAWRFDGVTAGRAVTSWDRLLRWAPGIAAGVATALVMLLVTLLSATESDHDLRVITAMGAPPRMRRRFLGLQAGIYTAIGAALALIISGVILGVGSRADRSGVITGPFGTVPSSGVAVDWLTTALTLIAPVVVGIVIATVVRSSAALPSRARA